MILLENCFDKEAIKQLLFLALKIWSFNDPQNSEKANQTHRYVCL